MQNLIQKESLFRFSIFFSCDIISFMEKAYKKISQTQIAKILKENIADKGAVFVFNTSVAVDTWTDFIVQMEGAEGWPKTLAADRFIAWDQFKGAAASVQEKDARSIPGLLRKLFARNLLAKIKEEKSAAQISGDEAKYFFERLINPKYAENALAFTDWLSQILPSLGSWHKLMSQKKFIEKDSGGKENLAAAQDTPENRDYLKLYETYSDFLQEKNLFEPTWQQLKFNPLDKNHYIIFYPELLDDYVEYREILEAEEKKGKLNLIHLQSDAEKFDQKIRASYYTSMRAELRMTALKILRENAGGIPWNCIAISVPKIEEYLPYVERELRLYDIPFVTRAGTMLGKTGAGLVFRKMQNCFESAFAFSQVRSFALDHNVPWKNPAGMQTLVRLGSELKCFCQYTDSNEKLVDPWLKDLPEAKIFQNDLYFEAQEFYKQLKNSVDAICKAKSFSAIKNKWIGAEGFEAKFFIEKKSMPQNANNILSRCIKKLDELIALEKEFPELCGKEISHFEFFLNEIETTQYIEQKQNEGVSIFPYKLSAMAAIPSQFVLNASQNAITVENPLLNFLPPQKRKILLDEKISQNDESQSYIVAYNKTGDCVFSIAEETLDGFAIPYATLTTQEKPCDFDEDLDGEDYFKQEKKFLQSKSDASKKFFPQRISRKIKNGFDFYFAANGFDCDADGVSDFMQEKILGKVSENGKIFISQSAMKTFFSCPRKWIFKNILALKEDTLDTDIFERYDAGAINHKILELYLKQTPRLPFTDEKTKQLFDEEKIREQIRKIIRDGAEEISAENEAKKILPFAQSRAYTQSSLAQEILLSQTEVFVETIINFLRWFCQKNLYGGWQIQGVEKKLQMQFENNKNVILDGKIDCVLSSGEDFAIVDFKNTRGSIPSSNLTVKPPKEEKSKVDADSANASDSTAAQNMEGELGDFQMPMYFKLFKANSDDKISSARFVPIKIKSLSEEAKEVITKEGKTSTTQATREDFLEFTIPLFDKYVEEMCGAINAAKYSVQNIKDETCAGKDRKAACDYRMICRTIYNTAGFKIISEASAEEN